jgi:hypothetical protein
VGGEGVPGGGRELGSASLEGRRLLAQRVGAPDTAHVVRALCGHPAARGLRQPPGPRPGRPERALEDFDNPQGHALVAQSVLRVYFRTSRLSLGYIREASGLDDSELETITKELQTQKGDFSEAYIDSEAHGRARVRIYLSDLEYWAVSSDPERDQPIRHLALAQSGGDPWGALRLLVDPAWHHEQARAITAAASVNGAATPSAGEPVDGG